VTVSRWWLRAVYAATAAFVTWQEWALGHVGNLVTFRTAAERLLAGQNLYAPIAGKLDYKYSPSFGALFMPFALPPMVIGLLLWNLVNAAVLLVAIERLLPSRRDTALALALIWPTMVTSLQNTQSNALVAGLVVLAFVAYERERPFGAGLAVATGAAIKIFPAAAALLGVFRGDRRRWIAALAAAGLLVVLLPLPVIGPGALVAQYRWWLTPLGEDLASRGDSVIGILGTWSGYGGPSWIVELAGIAALLLPLALRRDRWGDPAFRLVFLCSLLVFMVIFNHKAESPSYVIAMAGIAVWYATARRSAVHHVLIVLALLALWVATEAVVPGDARVWIREHSGKAAACLPCWLLMQRDLWRRAPPSVERAEVREVEDSGPEPLAHPL
jgi:hypothetical protein